MKCTIPEISWHNRDPVLSLDIQLQTEKEFYRLASSGSDSHVLIWHMILSPSGSINLDLAADLTRHQRAVNVVKWSHNGKLLASADDEGIIIIWKMKEDFEPLICDNFNDQNKECWITFKVLRGHLEDIYDLSWCPKSIFIASASIDNTAIIWNVLKGKSIGLLGEHKGFVQGVSWDPQNQYIATLCTDRYLRIFDIHTKKAVVRTNRCALPRQGCKGLDDKMERIFYDDTLQTFYRRLCFSPDGNLLITPAGIIESETESKALNTTYIFSRFSLKQPAIILASPYEYTIVVTFCPLLFKLKLNSNSNVPIISLPYRMIFAVGTKNSVYLYDTQQKIPFGIISNIHYTRLTDMTWSKDGKILAVSSTDGFCSLLTFTEGELGEIYNSEETEINKKYIVNYSNETCSETDMSKSSIILNNNKLPQMSESETNVKNSSTNIKGTFPVYDHIESNNLISNVFNKHAEHILNFEEIVNAESFGQRTELLMKSRDRKVPLAEEAMDAWPENSSNVIKTKQTDLIKTENSCRYPSELTEDLRLIYEDSHDEDGILTKQNQKQKEKDKNYPEECKTPRRVQLKTISIPKSKK